MKAARRERQRVKREERLGAEARAGGAGWGRWLADVNAWVASVVAPPPESGETKRAERGRKSDDDL
jgi:hypothetical protein